MISVLGCIVQEHDLTLVLLAAILCAFACWTTMILLERAVRSARATRLAWLAACGVVFGGGVWGTHFLAMLAFRSSLPVGYALTPTLLSIAAAVVIFTVAFALALRRRQRPLSGLIAGIGIAIMHYTGMQALHGPFTVVWDAGYVAASIAWGIGVCVLAGWIGGRSRSAGGRVGVAMLLTLAVCGLHFTGMTGMTLIPDGSAAYGGALANPKLLAVAIGAVAVFIVFLGFMSAMIDQRVASRAKDEAERLRAHVAALQATQSELEQASQQLRFALDEAAAASAAKAQFLAAMSHELRTPLNAVIGFAELINSEAFGPIGNPRYAEYAADIHDSGKHLLALINDVLDLTRLEAAKVALAEEDLDIGEIIADAAWTIAPQARAGEVEVRVSAACSCRLRGDRRRIRQVLLNLLSNAVKFTQPGGLVTLSCAMTPAGLTVAIRDTGIGMAGDDIPKALDRFAQIDSRLSRKYEGAGLGLPLAKHLMVLHGGTLALESLLGKGTLATIAFPASRLIQMQQAA